MEPTTMRGTPERRTALRRLRLLVPAVIAAAAVVVALPGTARPAFPGSNGKIAFGGSDSNLWVMDADGSNPTRLSTNQGGAPAWSPDGKKIAYSVQDIYVMDADGSNVKQLTQNTGSDFLPTWSPDGQKIAFESLRSGPFEIWVMNADGSSQTQLTSSAAGAAYDAAWSPDGQKIAFDNGYDIYVMNADGSNVTQLTHGAQNLQPNWSPDGQRIVFSSHRGDSDYFQLYVMHADGSALTRLTTSAVDDMEPAWSPDGSSIAFSGRSFDPEHTDVYSIDADGSNRTQLTTTGGQKPDWQPLAQPARTATVQQPINADGSSVFKAGKGALPVKFTLSVGGVPTCTLPPATLALTRLSGAVTGPVNESDFTGPADNGSDFRIDSCQYIYNLSLKTLSAGTYRAEIKIDGQTAGSATFELR